MPTPANILRLSLVLALLICAMKSKAQDSLLLLNGRTVLGQVNDDSGVDLIFDVQKGSKVKTLRYTRWDIYSYTKGEQRTVLYRKDSLLGFELSPQDMRYYMHGQNDARFGYNPRPTMYAGFALGCGAAVATNGDFRGLAMPMVYSLAMQIPVIRIRQSAISDQRNTVSEYYVEGFNKTARSKKFVSGFLSSFAGVVVGSLVLTLADG